MTGELDDEALAFAHRIFDLARSGDTPALTELVDAGLPVNLTNDKGDSLLILAAYHDHSATVRALLQRGADTTRVNDRGQTALGAAVFRRSAPGVEALLEVGADPALGSPSAIEVARAFDLPDMLAKLDPLAGSAT
ncbi:MAG: ankyrin repeat domain-containing protein [Acidimicrobiales bacterium]